MTDEQMTLGGAWVVSENELAHERLDALGTPRENAGFILSVAQRVLHLPEPAALSDPSVPVLGPFVADSVTSRKAALAAYPRAGSQRSLILTYLHATMAWSLPQMGATRDEIEVGTGIAANSVRPRVAELMEGGWVRATAITRKTQLGQQGEVLVLTDKAMKALAAR